MECIRVGLVSSVDVSNRTARVIFNDRGGTVSASLKVLAASPLITADITTHNEAWSIAEQYSSADRRLGRGERYAKGTDDTISGVQTAQGSAAVITVRGWLPYIGQTVLCAFITNGDGDGFVIGGV